MPAITIAPPGLALRVEAKPFAAAATAVARRIPTKPQAPVLAGLLLEVADDVLTLSGFDYDVSVQTRIPVTGATDGRALVSGRLLAELVKTFPDKPVDVACDGAQVTVRCGGTRLTLPTMPVEDYPTLPDLPPAVGTVAAETFVQLVERVAVAADRDASAAVPALTGVHIDLSGDQMQMRATDSYRAAHGSTPWQPSRADGADSALVPVGVLIDVARTFADRDNDVAIHLSDSLIAFVGSDRSATVRLLATEVQFPVRQMDAVFPTRSNSPAVVPIANLTAALRRADIVRAPRAPITLTFTEGSVAVHAQADGESTDDIACDYTGDGMTIAVNPTFLSDALSALRGTDAEFSQPTDGRLRRPPLLLTTPGDDDYRHLISPIKPSAAPATTTEK